MRAIVCHRYGSPDVLHEENVDKPVIRDDDVLVRVHAASVNSWDWELLQGRPLANRVPHLRKPAHEVLGSDIAGRVEAVGRGVTRFLPGDLVFGDLSGCGWGAFAEYARAAEDALAMMPIGLSFDQAAAAPQAGLLALQGIRARGPIRSGQKVLVNGAGGGVGTFAVQMAKSLGADVTGVDFEHKLDQVRSIGADHVIDPRAMDFTRSGERYDRIIDVAAHRSVFDYRRALNPSGIYVFIGGSSVRALQTMTVGIWTSMTGIRRVRLLVYTKPRLEDLAMLVGLLEAGTVVPVVDRIFSLSETAEAFRYFGAGQARGKVVINCE